MNNIQRLESLADEAYQEIFGVTKVTFEKMLSILNLNFPKKGTKYIIA